MTTYDGFQRSVTVATNEDGLPFPSANFTITSEITYDGLGRVRTKSNPHRGASASTDGSTTTSYDLLGRVLAVNTSGTSDGPGGTGGPTGTVATTYTGNQTTVTDQAGRMRSSKVDGLGRLAEVDELNLDGSTYNATVYGYDARGNLLSVNQNTSQSTPQRTFAYDGLSRLMTAANPESGTTSYTYDDDSNLQTLKRNSPQITTTMTYDALNRVMTKSYTKSDSTPEGTPNVTYHYDTKSDGTAITNGIGHLTSVSSSVSTETYDSFDKLGRVLGSTQTTPTTGGTPYGFSYTYNLAGEMLTEKYPSDKVINVAYDGVGRINTVYRTGGPTYASSIQYTAPGAMQSMTLGNGLIDQTTYNSRLEPTRIQLGSSSTGAAASSVLELDYSFNTSGQTDNNGNVLEQTIKIGNTTIADQTYSYDQVNRIAGATETTSPTPGSPVTLVSNIRL